MFFNLPQVIMSLVASLRSMVFLALCLTQVFMSSQQSTVAAKSGDAGMFLNVHNRLETAEIDPSAIIHKL